MKAFKKIALYDKILVKRLYSQPTALLVRKNLSKKLYFSILAYGIKAMAKMVIDIIGDIKSITIAVYRMIECFKKNGPTLNCFSSHITCKFLLKQLFM